MTKQVHHLVQDGIRKGMDYAGYISMMNDLVAKGKATGTEQSEERIAHKVRRIEKRWPFQEKSW